MGAWALPPCSLKFDRLNNNSNLSFNSGVLCKGLQVYSLCIVAMFTPFRTYGSPLHSAMRHSRVIVRSDAFPTLRPVRSFVSTSRVEDLQRQRSRSFQRTLTFCRYSGYFLLSSAFGVLAIGAGIFIHDALTYTYKHVDRVPCNPQALCPQTGGPNNLPVVKSLVDDDDDEEKRELAKKPRLIIVGGGWGVSLLS